MLQQQVEQQWYHRPHWLLLLTPLSWLFSFLSRRRRRRLTAQQCSLPLPVVIVGNIAVGGTGKTPVIIALVEALRERGWRPAVISQGYGGAVTGNTFVPADGVASEFGDEPVLIAKLAKCPVVVGRDRVQSVALISQKTDCNVILSDDGMQHYRLARDYEIAVIDGARGLGNGWLLPVGPLREKAARLNEVNWLLVNGNPKITLPEVSTPSSVVNLQPAHWVHVRSGDTIPIEQLELSSAHAVAGIGNPERFFGTLRSLGFAGATRSYADHHEFNLSDLSEHQNDVLLMTEKDAVKCQSFAGDQWWALAVRFTLPDELLQDLTEHLSNSAAKINHSIQCLSS